MYERNSNAGSNSIGLQRASNFQLFYFQLFSKRSRTKTCWPWHLNSRSKAIFTIPKQTLISIQDEFRILPGGGIKVRISSGGWGKIGPPQLGWVDLLLRAQILTLIDATKFKFRYRMTIQSLKFNIYSFFKLNILSKFRISAIYLLSFSVLSVLISEG